MKKTHYLICLLLLGCGTAQTITTPIPTKAEDISPILIGETLPQTYLKDAKGSLINLNDSLKQKPTVMIFYRGGWCPYCNMHLSELAQIEQEVINLGYQIIAISPDHYKNLQGTLEKDSIKYQLYSDSAGQFIQSIGIAFRTAPVLKGYAASKGQKGKTSKVLPVPTVLIVNNQGKVLFEYINPNYRERLSAEMLLAVLKTLKT